MAGLALPVRQALGVGEQARFFYGQLQAGAAQAHSSRADGCLEGIQVGIAVQHQQKMRALIRDTQQGRRYAGQPLLALVIVEPAQCVAIAPHERFTRRIQQQIARTGRTRLGLDPGGFIAAFGDPVEAQAETGKRVEARQFGPIHRRLLRRRTRSRSRRWSWRSDC